MSKGNTWCKKLMTKRKAQIMKERYGSMVPLSERIRKARLHGVKVLDEIEDMPDETVKSTKPKERELDALPRVAGWKPRPFGKKARSGCVYNPAR